MLKVAVVFLLMALATTVIAQEVVAREDLMEKEIFQSLISAEEDIDEGSSEETLNPEALSPRGLILSSIAKSILKTMLEQLPCGWPEKGIPPLAPYRNEEVNLSVHKSFVTTITQMLRLRVDGLDKMKIKKLSVSYTFKKVKFHFNFKKLQAKSGFNTDTFADLMKSFGISVRYEGKGDLDFSLHNLSIKGSFKYKLPLIFGSAKIYNFNAIVTLGDCRSNITGLAPSTKANRYINDQIEDLVLSAINDNQEAISARIEEAIVPTVNESLKGKNVWDIIAMKPPGPTEKCIPPPDPWAKSEE